MSLQLHGLTKRYGDATVLDDVSFAVEPGEILAVCGENGAGKSTLMNIVAGVLPFGRYDGRLELDGQLAAFSDPRDAERAGIALLPQELVYYPELSVAENVVSHVPAAHGWVRRRELRARARAMLEHVDLDVDVDTPMRSLETSQRQLVCIARTLSFDPRVLILDEPTAALPRAAAERLLAVLGRYRDEGRIVLYVSHHLSEVTELASRVAVLRNGRLVMAPRQRASVEEIVHAMVGSELETGRRRHLRQGSPAPAAFEVHVQALVRGDRTILEEVDFAVSPGEIVGLAGLAGSGREALLRALAGAPTGQLTADVTLAGERVGLSAHDNARRGISYVAQDRRSEGILPLADLWQNVLLGHEARGSRFGVRDRAAERGLVIDALRAFGVTPADPAAIIGRLSGGNQQKAVLARAALDEPSVLLLSEPTRGVDIGARAAIYDLIEAAADRGACVVVSSGDVTELLALSDRTLVMWHGRVIEELAGAQISEAALLAAINGDARSGPRVMQHNN
jgi:ABC-type sugar transport system ATPase subunit